MTRASASAAASDGRMLKVCGDDATPDDQMRLSDAGHDGTHQRVHRLDRGNDARPVCSGPLRYRRQEPRLRPARTLQQKQANGRS